MVFISFLTGLLMLFVFRATSNQEGIRRTKNKIKAHLLEMRLYKDSLSLTFKAMGNILFHNLKYIGHSVRPLLVMIGPILLILLQLNLWFGYQSIREGDPVLLKVKLKEEINPLEIPFVLESLSGMTVETPPLRIPEEREIDWRLRAKEKGVHLLTLHWNGRTVTQKIYVAQNRLTRISPIKVQKGFFREVLNPGETPLPKDAPLERMEVAYPGQSMNLFGGHVHWLIAFFVLSIVFGFTFKGIFKVEI